MSTDVDLNVKLPDEILRRIAELDLELAEGDITQKGYEKKKIQLLAPFVPTKNASQLQALKTQASPGTRATRRHQRRATRDENRYHSGETPPDFLLLMGLGPYS
uniref:DMAP1-binding domain-containing protein n=1 Tax=Romanomermis culicivorax TaxID=13658 RepID=A0A915KK79_ROMCU